MKRFENRTFTGGEIELDDSEFVNCTFKDCKLVYGGGKAPMFENPSFNGITVAFRNNALEVIKTLRVFKAHGLADFTEKAIERINADDALNSDTLDID